MKSYYKAYPCHLCGEIHNMYIHSYPIRKWRSPEDGRDHKIHIIEVICEGARKQKKQYTKRLLPDFLRPYCRIRLDLSLKYYTGKYNSKGKYHWDDACTFLGCLDTRTARRHLGDLQSQVPVLNLELAQIMAHKSGYLSEKEILPDTTPAAALALRARQVEEHHARLYGNLPPVYQSFYTPLGIVPIWLCGRNLSTSYVSMSLQNYDTS